MFETDTLAYDFTMARRVATLLEEEGVPALAEEYEIGMAHIRLDPEEEEPTGYIAVVMGHSEDDDSGEGEWYILSTTYDKELHTYETNENIPAEALGVAMDADPVTVADAIANYLN